MKTSVNFTILLLLISLVLSSCKKDDDKNNSATPIITTQQKIDAAVKTTREAVEAQIGKAVPTLNVFIQLPEGEYFSSSAGQGYQPMTADTYFRFASNTKNFTSTAAINMQEDGWLNIDHKITDTIPGSNIPYVPASAEWNIPYKDQITIKMLLNHSAGVYDVDNDSVPGCMGESYTAFTQHFDPDHQFTATEMVNQLCIHNLSSFVPGTGYDYSNTGYAITGEIIGRVYSFHENTNKHLTDYLHDYIYGPNSTIPLEMHFPYLATDQDLPSPFSCGHILYDSNNVEEICSYNMSAQVAEGNGYSTMRNLNTFIRTNLKAQNVLSAASVDLMKNSTSATNPTYGLGCFYKENLGYGHNGGRVGNFCLMIYDPINDISIITYISCFNIPDFAPTYYAIDDVAYAVREALGYPGKPTN